MLILIAGGLVMTASRFRPSSHQDLLAFDLIDQVNQEQATLNDTPEGYNYCQAPRPTLETYPAPKVNIEHNPAGCYSCLDGSLVDFGISTRIEQWEDGAIPSASNNSLCLSSA